MTTEFDDDTGKWLVKITGTGMRDSAEAGEMSDLQINGVSQTVRSHTDTMAVFEIIDVQDTNSLDLNLFFPVGLPKGHEIIRAGITLEPKFLSITPNEGSPGGTWITVSVAGVGKLTEGLNIEIDTEESLCVDRKLIVEEYGKATCWSNLGNKFGDVATDMKLKFGDSLLDCANADTSNC